LLLNWKRIKIFCGSFLCNGPVRDKHAVLTSGLVFLLFHAPMWVQLVSAVSRQALPRSSKCSEFLLSVYKLVVVWGVIFKFESLWNLV
jgi:hypothetical protein